MPRSKRSGDQLLPTNLGPRERGLRAFQSGRFDAAIAAWQPLADDPAVARALAEAHFRRAITIHAADPITDLERAAALAPADPRFPFHIGRLLHLVGKHEAAAGYYRTVLSHEPGNSTAARLLALAILEQRSDADISDLPGMSSTLQAWIAPALAALRGRPTPSDDSPLGTLWHGIALLAADNPDAYKALGDERMLPVPALEPLRRHFRAIAAARGGETATALKLWQRLYDAGERPPGLQERLAALLMERLTALVEAGDVAAAGDLAERSVAIVGGSAFDELRLLALDQAAQAAATAGQWLRAALLWEAARQILSRAQGLGSPRPILHNLALAYERQERWEAAADAWRALLRTRSRRRASDTIDTQDEQRWAWVRTRIITCYRNAGRPDEAVTVFRQAIKLDPNDLDLRIQLADALLANEQERASLNEINRILAIDPYYPEALLRRIEYLSQRWQFAEAEQLARELAERNPHRADLRRSVGNVFLQHGREYAQYANYQAAYNAFVEGERYQPDNPRFPLNQARMLGALGRPGDTGALIERALTVGGEIADTWLLAIETWMMVDKLDEARTLIGRFERERAPAAEDYLDLGIQLMGSALPPPAPSFFGKLAAPAKPVDTPWIQLALELLDKAASLRPDDGNILKAIANFLMVPRPDLALRFIERAVEQAPEDVETLILLGIVLGFADKVAEAKATLQRAGKLAQRQHRPDLREHAKQLRQVIGTPMLRLMFSQALHEFEAFDDLDEIF